MSYRSYDTREFSLKNCLKLVEVETTKGCLFLDLGNCEAGRVNIVTTNTLYGKSI